MVRWLRLHAPNAGAQIKSLVRELGILLATTIRSHIPLLRPSAASIPTRLDLDFEF